MCIVLIWFVWSFLLVLFCGSRGKKAGTTNNCCMTSVYILYTGWHKQPPKMSFTFTNAEKEKWWDLEAGQFIVTRVSVHSFGLLFCRRMKTATQLQKYNAVYRMSQKGQWGVAFLGSEQSSVAFFFSLVKHICCLIPWEHKISNQTGSFGPEVLILFFSNFFVKWPYPQFT